MTAAVLFRGRRVAFWTADCADLFDYEARALEAVAGSLGEPVHLAAHSYGANLALLAALAGRIAVRSLVLFEPTLAARHRRSRGVLGDRALRRRLPARPCRGREVGGAPGDRFLGRRRRLRRDAGEGAHPAAKLIARRIGERIARGRVVEIAGANHFMIFTHPAETARIIRESVSLQ